MAKATTKNTATETVEDEARDVATETAAPEVQREPTLTELLAVSNKIDARLRGEE